MDLFKQGMKGPSRPAPSVPGIGVNRYSPVTNWDNDPFGADVFEPTPHMQKKKPPPRPPPPKLNRQPDIPAKPSHFIRKPTVLSSLLSRKTKTTTTSSQSISYQQTVPDLNELDTNKMFPKCEPKNVQMGTLIDLSSPPSSPTFTTRSSSDGLSVDSFGSDATTSTNNHNNHNGNASQAESGFEDDFDLFLSSRKILKEDTLDSITTDPFSPQPVSNKPPIFKKPVIAKDPFGLTTNVSSQGQPALKGPTIIRAKPARPKPPENSALLKTTFGNNFPVMTMTLNTTTPIQKVCNGFGDSFNSKPFSWDESDSSPERESSPPMPSIPPPPPPAVEDDLPMFDSLPDDLPEHLRRVLNVDTADISQFKDLAVEEEEPYAIAVFDYSTDHPDDLCFTTNTRIKLLRRIDKEWLYGSLRNGSQGVFPSNYVEIKVPLPNESLPSPVIIGTAMAMYDFEPDQPGDLAFRTGDAISVQYKLNDEWYFGVCNGRKGQFPINYVQMS